jgi:hypothetical protein
MASPSALHIHGTADANDLLDEPASNAVLDVTEFKFALSRERRERRNASGAFRRLEYFNPLLTISLTAFIVGGGLATQEVGTRVTSLANFAAERRGMDPAVGTMILEDTEDSLTLEEDAKTTMQILHAPFVITA